MAPKNSAGDASLKRLGGGRWQTRDERFTIEPQSGTWSLVDAEETDELGLPLFVPDLAAKPEINEETAMSAGLQDVALGVFPDRSSTSVRGAETTIRLSFDM